jgi:hypothetical protein
VLLLFIPAKQKIQDNITKHLFEQFKQRFIVWSRFRDPKYAPLRRVMLWASPWERSTRWRKYEELDNKWREHFEFVEPDAQKYQTASQWLGQTETAASSVASMPLPEAVKVLQLTEATAEHVMERYKILQAANNFKGASVYIRDKVEVAKQTALRAQQDGKLGNYIKPKEKPPTPSPTTPTQEQPAEAQSGDGSSDTPPPPPGGAGEEPTASQR